MIVFWIMLIAMLVMFLAINITRAVFDDIHIGENVVYFEESLPIYDVVVSNREGIIMTKLGKEFDYLDYLRGNFQVVKK